MTIYKYLAPARVDVLANAKLRATQADALNDPFELKPAFTQLFDCDYFRAEVTNDNLIDVHMKAEYEKQPEEFRAQVPWEKIRSLVKIREKEFMSFIDSQMEAIYATEHPQLTKFVKELMHEKFGKIIGIVSFSTTPSETLMWSHYARDHKGFVIGFNEANKFFDRRRSDEDELYHLRNVVYSEMDITGRKLSDLDGTAIFCTKQPQWSYEQEKRILIPIESNSNSSTEDIHLIEFPRNAVECVILGERASDELSQNIKVLLSSHPAYENVKLLRAHANIDSGKIQILSM